MAGETHVCNSICDFCPSLGVYVQKVKSQPRNDSRSRSTTGFLAATSVRFRAPNMNRVCPQRVGSIAIDQVAFGRHAATAITASPRCLTMNISRTERCLMKRLGRDALAGCRALAFLTMGLVSMECATATERPQGSNCHLAAPPRMAGEINAPGEIMFVYPRTKDIKMGYRGCQTIWTRVGHGGWEVYSLVRIEHRAVVEVWPPPPDGESADHCAYSHGHVAPASPASCRALVTLSYPAGCMARGVKTPVLPSMPKGCQEG